MNLRRLPRGPLRPFVKLLWLAESSGGGAGARERVLPTGGMHVVIRLTDEPLRIFDRIDAATGTAIGRAVVGGARAGYYIRDVSQPSRSVGAMLHAGAALPLLGVTAEALAGRHTPLDELWRDAGALRERLIEAGSPEAQLDLFEAILEQRLPRVRGVHPAVAHALARFSACAEVGAVVGETGYSHRRFITVFRDAVGLTPKRYCRVLRLQRVLAQLHQGDALGDIAYAAGYSDQAHLHRELVELAGVTPGELRRLAPEHTHHVPVVQIRSRRSAPRGAR